jgi:hypothetical protein
MTNDYQAYLQSKAWQRLREQVFNRSRGRCEAKWEEGFGCERRAVEVHHKTYARLYCEKLGDLEALCSEHHRWRHGLLDEREKRALEDEAIRRAYQPQGR